MPKIDKIKEQIGWLKVVLGTIVYIVVDTAKHFDNKIQH